MRREIRADYSQTFLLPPSLEDWVGVDHPARFIRDFVASIDMEGLGFRVPELSTGRPPYSVGLLLSVWLYGYLNRIRSNRQLERACREHVSLLWLTGMHSPDHNTLWRFWRTNREALRGVFRQVVLVAYDSGLVGLAVHAVDGTKIRSVSSSRSGCHKKELQSLLKHLEASIAEAATEIESSEAIESGEYRLPDNLIDAEGRRAEIRKSLQKLSEIDRDHYHPGEPDTRMMKTGEGVGFSYNAQVVVDGESSLITAAEVVNDESDNDLLVEMVEQVQETLGEAAQETVADGGYYSPNQLAEAEKCGLGVLVPVLDKASSQGNFHKSRFRYDESEDVYICPRGKCLRFERVKYNKYQRYHMRVYLCDFSNVCSVRHQCCGGKGGRRVYRGEHDEAVSRQREKQREGPKRELMRSRKTIVEPSFASIKEHMGFRRWTVRNLENVKTQWSLICTAFNLKKLHRHWLEGRLILNR